MDGITGMRETLATNTVKTEGPPETRIAAKKITDKKEVIGIPGVQKPVNELGEIFRHNERKKVK